MMSVAKFDGLTMAKRNAREELDGAPCFVLLTVLEDGTINMVHSELEEGLLDEIIEALDDYANS